MIESHSTFKTAEAAATAAAEDGRGPAQRKGGYEARAVATASKASADMNAAILKAFVRGPRRGAAGALPPLPAAGPPTNGGCSRMGAPQPPNHTSADAARAAASAVAAAPAANADAPRAAAAQAPRAGGAVSAVAMAQPRQQEAPPASTPEVLAQPRSRPDPAVGQAPAQPCVPGAATSAAVGTPPASSAAVDVLPPRSRQAPPEAIAAAAVMSAQHAPAERDRRNGSRGGTPVPESSVGRLGPLGLSDNGVAGVWGALGGVLGHAASSSQGAVSSGAGLSQLLSSAAMMGGGGHAALGYSGAMAAAQQASSLGMSAAHSQLLGALGGGLGMGFSGGLPVASVGGSAAPQVHPASSGVGITAAEQEVIDALRAQAQLQSVQERAPPPPSPAPLVPPHLLMSAPQQGVLWPGAGWPSASASAPARASAAPAPEPPPASAEELNPAASITPQHMDLLVALLNGQDVRSHPGYQSLRQVLLGRQQLTYEDLLRNRWSGQ